jgi:hypothetical protein
VEANELLNEVKRDPGGLRLIRQTLGHDEKISPSQASKVRAHLRQRLREEQATMEGRDQGTSPRQRLWCHLSGCRADGPPSACALLHIGVVALGIVAVIPVLGRGRLDRYLR